MSTPLDKDAVHSKHPVGMLWEAGIRWNLCPHTNPLQESRFILSKGKRITEERKKPEDSEGLMSGKS